MSGYKKERAKRRRKALIIKVKNYFLSSMHFLGHAAAHTPQLVHLE